MIRLIPQDSWVYMYGMVPPFSKYQGERVERQLVRTGKYERDWQPDIKGLKGSASKGLEAYRIYKNAAADYVLEGNITLGERLKPGSIGEGTTKERRDTKPYSGERIIRSG